MLSDAEISTQSNYMKGKVWCRQDKYYATCIENDKSNVLTLLQTCIDNCVGDSKTVAKSKEVIEV